MQPTPRDMLADLSSATERGNIHHILQLLPSEHGVEFAFSQHKW